MKDHNPGKSFASPLTDENEIFMPFFSLQSGYGLGCKVLFH